MSTINKDNLLLNIITGIEKSRIVAISHDKNVCKKEIIKVLAKNCFLNSHLISLEDFSNELELNKIFSLNDYLKYENNNINNLVNEIKNEVKKTKEDKLLILDSLNLLLLNFSTYELYKFISHLSNNYLRVFILFNDTIATNHQVHAIKEVCSSFITLQKKNITSNEIISNILHKKNYVRTKYKIYQTSFNFSITADFLLIPSVKVNVEIIRNSIDTCLNLENEEEIKNNPHVQPYIKAQQKCKVFYMPDKNDDVDEEDPDDDLLI